MANHLDSQLFFSLSIQYKDFANLLPLIDIIVFSYERSQFLHKNVMVHVQNPTWMSPFMIIQKNNSEDN